MKKTNSVLRRIKSRIKIALNCLSMFCASSDTLQSITEKTKLLAQKCHQCLSPLKKDVPLIGGAPAAAAAASVLTASSEASTFKCFCPCKGPLNYKVLAKKTNDGGGVPPTGCCKISATAISASKEPSSTKWYVKVIQINNLK